jgi:antitoxin ParD1/3/4
MNISLTPDLEDFVARKIQSGAYPGPSEVVCEALRLLHDREKEAERLEALRREIAVGIEQADQGQTSPFTEEVVERIKANGRRSRSGEGGAS